MLAGLVITAIFFGEGTDEGTDDEALASTVAATPVFLVSLNSGYLFAKAKIIAAIVNIDRIKTNNVDCFF